MRKIKQIEILNELVTVFEERVLDDNCFKHNMKWENYIRLIINGWNPDNVNNYLLECYRLAIKKLKRSGKRKDSLYD